MKKIIIFMMVLATVLSTFSIGIFAAGTYEPGNGEYFKRHLTNKLTYEYSHIRDLNKTNDGTCMLSRPNLWTNIGFSDPKIPGIYLKKVETGLKSNTVLEYRTSTESILSDRHHFIAFKPQNGFNKTNNISYIFETDIYVNDIKELGTVDQRVLFTFQLNDSLNNNITKYQVNATNYNSPFEYTLFGEKLKTKTWYNIRLKYNYESGILTTFINNKETESYTFQKEYDVKYINFEMNNVYESASIYIDNTYIGQEGKEEGILNVWTFINDWFKNSINNVQGLFYNTKEQELTLLGNVSVIGVGIGIIMLLISKIKDFFNSRG